MEWKYILDEQPKDGEMIVQIDEPAYGRSSMGITEYYQKCSFEEVLAFYKNHDMGHPDFWWVSVADFPFPQFKNGEKAMKENV
jgi:hypothetical protein